MQISNPVSSQYLSGTVNRSQQTDRFPVKSIPVRPEPIEGQLIDDNETPAQLIVPATVPKLLQKPASENFADSFLIQKKLSDNPAVPSQNESSPAKQNFPYGHRRSIEGLTGSSLVIQKYLNNESPAPIQSGNYQRNIDLFI